MPNNPFIQHQMFEPQQDRNSYDMSKNVNGTYKLGYLYPTYCRELYAGDTYILDSKIGLRAFPTVFPLQTPMYVKQYYFFVPYRILWDNWKDFQYNNRQCVVPYIKQRPWNPIWRTGQIADRLGVPTTLLSTGKSFRSYALPNIYSQVYTTGRITTQTINTPVTGADLRNNIAQSSDTQSMVIYPVSDIDLSESFDFYYNNSPIVFTADGSHVFHLSIFVGKNFSNSIIVFDGLSVNGLDVVFNSSSEFGSFVFISPSDSLDQIYREISVKFSELYDLGSFDSSVVLDYLNEVLANYPDYKIWLGVGVRGSIMPASGTVVENTYMLYKSNKLIHELSDDNVLNPFAYYREDTPPMRPLFALPFRGYEAIYRSYFQDLLNEPFTIDGEQQFNRWVTNKGDGADDVQYHLFMRNYESDFLTSARPSPQQGVAPLVGIDSANGDLYLRKENGDLYSVHYNASDDGTISDVVMASQSSPSDSSIRRTLSEMVNFGFSINSFRNTNAFQRWLEDNQRRGVKWPDQQLAHTGIKPRYDDYDEPLYIGGYNVPIQTSAIYQQTGFADNVSPLGAYAGQMGAFGSQKHQISYRCDEPGMLYAITCVVPIPVYTQLLPKMFIKDNPLDFYDRKFSKIGLQPITYEEVCPVQAANEGVPLTDVFGYQRPWYHLISDVDEAHGQMRTNMHTFLMMRQFGQTPTLGGDFLHINPAELNDVFTITDESEDVLQGQIYYSITKKTDIPRFGIPQLEV